MSQSRNQAPRDEKDRLADALAAMGAAEPGTDERPDASHPQPEMPEPPAVRSAQRAIASPPMPADRRRAAAPSPARPSAVAPAIDHGQIIRQNLELRRTLIPMSFTAGLLLLVTGLVRWMVDPMSPLAALSTGLSLSLLAVGIVLIAAGVLNMLSVRHILERHPPR
jgi:hypothetical protein